MKGKLYLILVFFFFRQLCTAQSYTTPLLQDLYPKRMGNLRLSDSHFDFGIIFSNETRQDTIRILNTSIASMSVSVLSKPVAYLKMIVNSSPLPPGGKGMIIASFDATKKNDPGFSYDRLILATDDNALPQKPLSVSATIAEYFSDEQMNDSLRPVILCPETAYVYTRQISKLISHDFKIYNSGKKILQIRKTRADNNFMKVTVSKKEIIAGDSAVVHVDYDTNGKSVADERKISLYSNDPLNPEMTLKMQYSDAPQK
jgi:hypothetical protein